MLRPARIASGILATTENISRSPKAVSTDPSITPTDGTKNPPIISIMLKPLDKVLILLPTELTYNKLFSILTCCSQVIDNSLTHTNPTHAKFISNLAPLCKEVLEPLREYVQEPVIISSGYRCPRLNSHPEVRGSSTSQHLNGEAADIHLPMISGTHIQDLEKGMQYIGFILSHCHYHQVIWEHDTSGNYWIHVSIKQTGTNKHEYITNLLKK